MTVGSSTAGDRIVRRPRIVSVGALIVDLTFWAPRRPAPGETLRGDRFEEFLGGKGFNQAIAAARLGASVHLIGAVGRDHYADRFRSALAASGVDPGHVHSVAGGTGVGQPLVTADGEVSILGIPRANDRLAVALVEEAADVIAAADYLLLQCEVPLEVSVAAARIARSHHVRVMLNPAPAGHAASVLAEHADVLVLNLQEARLLADDVVCPTEDLPAALAKQYGSPVVVTLGELGAAGVADETLHLIGTHEVRVVDPTGAGDAFCAAFAVAAAEGGDMAEALRFATAAGGAAVRVAGAEPSMPSREIVASLLADPDAPHVRVLPLGVRSDRRDSPHPGPDSPHPGPGVRRAVD